MTDKQIPTQQPGTLTRIEELMRHDEAAAEKLFNRLSLQEKVRQVLAAPWETRVRLIMLADNPRKLVQALPEEELYWTLKQHGPEDALSIITMTTHDQFQYIIDIDCWQRDNLDVSAVERWYRLLSKCHESKVIEWFVHADEPLLVSTLKQLMYVEKVQEDSDVSEEYARMPLHTLDGVYYFSFLRDDAQGYLMPMLRALYHYNPQLFYSLMEGIITDFSAEALEEALHWRTSRIAEHGFPDLDEAASVYQIITDKEIELLQKGVAGRKGKKDLRQESFVPTHRHSIAQCGIPQLLDEALRLLPSPEFLENFQKLLVNVANKVLCADGRPPSSFDDTVQAMKKTLGYVTIGLEILGHGNTVTMPGILGQVHPEILFRIGSSSVQKLQRRFFNLKKSLWQQAPDRCVEFFDSPWSDALQGLQSKRPLLFEGLLRPGALEYRDFMSLREVQILERVVDMFEALSKLLFQIWGIDSAHLFSEDFIGETMLSDVAEIKSSAVFLTLIANHVLYRTFQLKPLTAEELYRFLESVFEPVPDRQQYRVRPDFSTELPKWLRGEFLREDRLGTAFEDFVSSCLSMLEDEFSLLIGKKTIDTRYVGGLILIKGA